MKVQNTQPYDITCMIGGKHYYFHVEEIKEIPDQFRGIHNTVLKEVIEVVKIVKLPPQPVLPPEIKEKIKRIQKNATSSVTIDKKTENQIDDKPVFSPKIDQKIKSKLGTEKVETGTETKRASKRKGIKAKKSKISREKRLQIKMRLDKDKQSRR